MKPQSKSTCPRLHIKLLSAALLFTLTLPEISEAGWGYRGRFYLGIDETRLFSFENSWFSSSDPASSKGGTGLNWTSAPEYSVALIGSSSYATDFGAFGSSDNWLNFTRYRTFSYNLYSEHTNAMFSSMRPYGVNYFGARNRQPITGDWDIDGFKSINFNARKLAWYIPGNNPAVSNGRYSPRAWRIAGSSGGGTVSFPLRNPGVDWNGTQERKYVHTATIPYGSKSGSANRHVWWTSDSFSAALSSGIYFIRPSQWESFRTYGQFSYFYKRSGTGSPNEIRPPHGSYYVVAINARNTTRIHAGGGVSSIVRYR